MHSGALNCTSFQKLHERSVVYRSTVPSIVSELGLAFFLGLKNGGMLQFIMTNYDLKTESDFTFDLEEYHIKTPTYSNPHTDPQLWTLTLLMPSWTYLIRLGYRRHRERWWAESPGNLSHEKDEESVKLVLLTALKWNLVEIVLYWSYPKRGSWQCHIKYL